MGRPTWAMLLWLVVLGRSRRDLQKVGGSLMCTTDSGYVVLHLPDIYLEGEHKRARAYKGRVPCWIWYLQGNGQGYEGQGQPHLQQPWVVIGYNKARSRITTLDFGEQTCSGIYLKECHGIQFWRGGGFRSSGYCIFFSSFKDHLFQAEKQCHHLEEISTWSKSNRGGRRHVWMDMKLGYEKETHKKQEGWVVWEHYTRCLNMQVWD